MIHGSIIHRSRRAVFRLFSTSMYYTEHKPKNKNGGGLGTRLVHNYIINSVLINITSTSPMKHKHLIKFPLATEEETEKWESSHKKSQWSHIELDTVHVHSNMHWRKCNLSVIVCMAPKTNKMNACPNLLVEPTYASVYRETMAPAMVYTLGRHLAGI